MKKLFILCFALMTMVVNISIAQIITTVAGNGTSGFSGDGSLATGASLYSPKSIAFDAQGNLYFADGGNNRVRKVDKITGIITTIAGDGLYDFGGDGGPAINAHLKTPSDLAFDAAGNLYIADEYNRRIRKVDLSGIITTVAGDGNAPYFGGDGGLAINAQLSGPSNLAINAAGDIFISDFNNSRIRKVDAATGIISTIAGLGNFIYFDGDGGPAVNANIVFPAGIKVDALGNIYFSDYGNGRIRKIDGATGIINTIAGDGTNAFGGDNGPATNAQINHAFVLTLNAAGDIFIADNDNNRIRKIDATTGIISTVAGDGTASFGGDGGAPLNAQLNHPYAVAFDNSNNLFISDRFNNRIRKVGIVAPTNIDCGNATELTTSVAGNPSCENPVNGSNIGVAVNDIDCSGYNTAYAVWYKFIATQSYHRIVLRNASPGNIFSLHFYRGSCASLISEACAGNYGVSDSLAYNALDLTVGQTYYFSVVTPVYLNSQGTFSVCVTSPVSTVPPPANDNICNAIPISVSVDETCNPVAGTTAGATPHVYSESNQLNDVWYSFIAQQSFQKVTVTAVGSFPYYPYTRVDLYSGDCNNPNYFSSTSGSYGSDVITVKFGNLTPGATYYLSIGVSTIINTSNDFTVCVTSPPVPVNDDCLHATELTPTTLFVGTAGSNANVEHSPYGTCGGFYHDDVWYRFAASSTTHKIVVKGYDFVSHPGSIEYFTGNDCSNLVSAGCATYAYDGSDSIVYEMNNLTIGNIYYFTVFSPSYDYEFNQNFLVGVTGAPGPPIGCTYTVPDVFENPSIITSNYGAICDFNGESDYSDNLNGYTIIRPVVPGGLVKLDFTLFNTDFNDLVYIYDGEGIYGTLLYSGSGNPATLPSVTSTTGSLTILFQSDGDGIVGPGFSALISNLPNPCPGTTLYVDATMPSSGYGNSWGSAFKTLGEALYVANKCTDVTEIHISQGTYYPTEADGTTTTSRDSSFTILRDGYKLMGGYNRSEERDYSTYMTILSGNIGLPGIITDNSYHVVTISSLAGPISTQPLIEGITIEQGNADGSSSFPGTSSQNGGGIYTDARFNSCFFSLNQVYFRDNTAVNGGAMYNNADANFATCSLTITNCNFSSSTATQNGGAIYINSAGYSSNSNNVIDGCRFAGSTALQNGAAIYNYAANSQAHSTCLISNSNLNNGHALNGAAIATKAEASGYASSEVTTSIFKDNIAGQNGAAMFSDGRTGQNHSGVTRSSFINNNAGSSGGALYLIAGNFTDPGNAHTAYEFSNCVFLQNNAASQGGAIAMENGINENELRVINCTFNENKTNGISSNIIQYSNFSSGIYTAAIINSIFGNDLIEPDQSRFFVRNCLINEAYYSGNQNIISGTPGYINASDPRGFDNLYNTADDGLRLSASSAAIDAGFNIYAPVNDIVNAPRPFGPNADMGAYESLENKPIASCPGFARLYVDGSKSSSGNGSSWTQAFKTVSEALYIANQCTIVDSIFVAEGIYHPANDDGSISSNKFNNFRIFRNNIKLYGGYPAGGGTRNIELHPTILSGDINNDDIGITNNEENNYHILIIYPDSLAINAITNNTIVDGFTFTGGNAGANTGLYTIIRGREILYWLGGAIYNKADYASSFAESSPLINNCTFINNNAYRGGGAIFSTANNGKTAPVISNCTFRNNNSSSDAVGGGAIAIDGYSYPNPPLSKLFLEKCVFENNHAVGTGGALAATFGVAITANNTVFSANAAPNGAAINLISNGSQNALFNNCLFVNNTASNTGSVFNGGLAGFNNCTFSGNNTTVGNNELFGALNPGAEPFKRISISNCIFDIGSDIFDNGFGSLTTKYTVKNTFIRQAAFTGNGNITGGSPFFTAAFGLPAGDDGKFGTADDAFQLASSSPCVDAGDTTGLGNIIPVTDLRGNNRIYNNVIDMGCYEKSFTCSVSLSQTHTNTLCNATPAGTITVTPSGASGIVNYVISPGFQNNTTGIFTGLAAGSYNIHAEDENNCSSSINVTITTIDVTPPVISTCPAPLSITSTPPYCLAVVPDFKGDVVASDNCSNVNQLVITQSPAAGSLVSVGVTTVTVTVTDAFGNFTNCLTTFTVTGTPPGKPSAITAEAGYSNVCSIIGTATSVRYSVTAVAGYSYDWVIPQHTIIDSGSNGNKIRLRFLEGYVYDVNDSLKVRARSSCGTGILYSKLAIKSSLPSVPSSTSGASSCGPGTVTLKATALTGYTIDWYDSGGVLLQSGTLSGSNLFNTVVTVTTIYYAAVRSLTTGCSSPKVAVTATVNPLPFAPAIASVTPVCSRGTSTITVVPSPGTSFSWFSTATGGTAIKTINPFVTGNVGSNTTYYVEAKNTATGCISATRTMVTVVVYPYPAIPVTAGQTICSPASVTLSATAGAGETIDWYLSGNGTAVATGSNTYTTPVISVTTTYYAYARNITTGCISARATAIVTVAAPPSAPTLNPVSICGPGVANLSATAATGITIDWYDAGGVLLQSGTASGFNVYHAPVTVNTLFYAASRKISTGCVSARVPITVRVNPLPEAPVALTSAAVCQHGTVTLSVVSLSGIHYNWYSAATGGHPNFTGSSYTTPAISVSTTYYVEAVNILTGCYSTPRLPVVAVVNPAPAAPISGGDVAICGQGTATLSASAGVGQTVVWYASATGGAALATGNDYTTPIIRQSTNYYAATLNPATGCYSATRTVIKAIVSGRIPATPAAITGPTDICPYIGSATAEYSIVAVAFATSYDWAVPAGAIITNGAGSANIKVAFSNLNLSGDIITVKARSGCGVSAASSIAININACPPSAKGVVNNPVQKSNPVINTVIAPLANEGMDVTVYPNPTNADFNLKVITASKEKIQVKISDLQGRLLKRFTVMPYQTVQIGNELLAGVYMIEVRQGKYVKTSRVIKF